MMRSIFPRRTDRGWGPASAVSEQDRAREATRKMLREPRGHQDIETVAIKPPTNFFAKLRGSPPKEEAPSPPRTDEEYVDELLEEVRAPGAFKALRTLDYIFAGVQVAFVGGGSFGQVFRIKKTNNGKAVEDGHLIKIIALEPRESVLPGTTTVERALGEAKLAKQLSSVKGFSKVHAIHIAQSHLPQKFREAKPAVPTRDIPKHDFDNGQLWMAIEMEDAGLALCHYKVRSIFVVWDVFWGVAMALARAEAFVEFEHRDLSISNICIMRRKNVDPDGPFTLSKEEYLRAGRRESLGHSGYRTTIIDYGLSRARIQRRGDATPFIASNDGIDLFNFQNRGNISCHARNRQAHFDVRQEIHRNGEERTVSNTSDRYKQYVPMTNKIWLQQLLVNLTTTSSHDRDWGRLKPDEELVVSWKRHENCKLLRGEFESRLISLQRAINDGEHRGIKIRSASDIVKFGLESNWFTEDHVVGNW